MKKISFWALALAGLALQCWGFALVLDRVRSEYGLLAGMGTFVALAFSGQALINAIQSHSEHVFNKGVKQGCANVQFLENLEKYARMGRAT